MKSHRTAALSLAGIYAGAALALAGVAWEVFGAADVVYTPQQAQEYETASAALHAATIGHAHGDHVAEGGASDGPPQSTEDRKAEVAKARQRFDRAKAALVTARFVENGLGSWIVAAGLAISAGFGVGYLSVRR